MRLRAWQSRIFWRKQPKPWRCFYCDVMLFRNVHINAPNFGTIDHFIPVSAGGKHAGNIVASCRRCNQLKGSMVPEKTREEIQGKMRISLGELIVCPSFRFFDKQHN